MNLKVNDTSNRWNNAFKCFFSRRDSTPTMFNKFRNAVKSSLLPMIILATMSGNAQAVDLLAGGKEVANDTFGANSTIAVWIILAEVIVGAIGYIRTKNIMLLLGVAIVVVFTTIAFGLAS